ncbi:hypothetical protein TNCV_1952401 [Trichonephila clavipes]|nr:hypothetical protein TNCV_1952401 [Trichonephila clavipes]
MSRYKVSGRTDDVLRAVLRSPSSICHNSPNERVGGRACSCSSAIFRTSSLDQKSMENGDEKKCVHHVAYWWMNVACSRVLYCWLTTLVTPEGRGVSIAATHHLRIVRMFKNPKYEQEGTAILLHSIPNHDTFSRGEELDRCKM